jgi:hypothetical protein
MSRMVHADIEALASGVHRSQILQFCLINSHTRRRPHLHAHIGTGTGTGTPPTPDLSRTCKHVHTKARAHASTTAKVDPNSSLAFAASMNKMVVIQGGAATTRDSPHPAVCGSGHPTCADGRLETQFGSPLWYARPCVGPPRLLPSLIAMSRLLHAPPSRAHGALPGSLAPCTRPLAGQCLRARPATERANQCSHSWPVHTRGRPVRLIRRR